MAVGLHEVVHSKILAAAGKAVHLLIQRIEAKREDNKTDFKIESTLKPVLEKVVAGEEFELPEGTESLRSCRTTSGL